MYYFVEEKAKKIPPHKKYFFKIRKYIGAALGLHDGGLFHFVSEKDYVVVRQVYCTYLLPVFLPLGANQGLPM